jgi:DNA-directed RNA polymerase specialized sigma24 family protein
LGKEEGVRYIERLFPGIRPRYVHQADDEDICQIVLCDILKKWDTLGITNDKEFTYTFHRFYGTSKWVQRSRKARALAGGTYWMSHAGGIPAQHRDDGQGPKGVRLRSVDPVIESNPSMTTAYNPWVNHRVEALEWISYLPTPLYRRIFTLHFIEGYSQSEVGALIGSYRERVGIIINEGIQLLKATHKAQQEEGRNVSVAPTLKGVA